MIFTKKGKCIRGKDTEQRNGYGLQRVNAISQNCEKHFQKLKRKYQRSALTTRQGLAEAKCKTIQGRYFDTF